MAGGFGALLTLVSGEGALCHRRASAAWGPFFNHNLAFDQRTLNCPSR